MEPSRNGGGDARASNLAALRARWAGGAAADATPGVEPVELFVEISTHCNLRCPHCPRESDEGILSGRTIAHLKPAWFPRVSSAMRTAYAVHACGLGEPTLHHGLEELCRLAREAGHALAIRTNGVRLGADRARSLADAGLAEVHVSIDGGTPETFTRLRPPADPARVLSNLGALVATGRLGVVVHAMLTEETAAELPALLAELERAGVRRVTAAPRAGTTIAPDATRAASERAAASGIHFRVIDAPWTSVPVEPAAGAGPGMLGDLPATSRLPLPDDEPPLRAMCARPFTTAYVAADGRIGTCENGLHRLGSLATQTVAEAFAGRAFEDLRARMRDGVVPPECRACVCAGRRVAPREDVEPAIFELSAPGEARVRSLPDVSVEVSPIVRKPGAATVPVDVHVQQRAPRPRRVRVAMEWRAAAGGAREWLAPPRLEELPAGFARDVHIDAPVPAALDANGGLAIRFLVEDAATGRVLVDETHAVAVAAKKGAGT